MRLFLWFSNTVLIRQNHFKKWHYSCYIVTLVFSTKTLGNWFLAFFRCDCDEGSHCVLTDNWQDRRAYVFHCRERDNSSHMFPFPDRKWDLETSSKSPKARRKIYVRSHSKFFSIYYPKYICNLPHPKRRIVSKKSLKFIYSVESKIP